MQMVCAKTLPLKLVKVWNIGHRDNNTKILQKKSVVIKEPMWTEVCQKYKNLVKKGDFKSDGMFTVMDSFLSENLHRHDRFKIHKLI